MIRVLLVSQFPLFSEGLHKLLACKDQIQIVAQEEDAARAMKRFKALQPDVVIVDNESPSGDLATLSLRILKEGKQVRVLGLSLRENSIYVYRKEHIIAHRVEDLMNAIESDLPVSDLASPAELSAFAAARSRVYGFLGAVYNRMPDEQFAGSLASPEMAAFLSSLGEMEDQNEDIREGLLLIEEYILASKQKSVEAIKTELAVERTRLVRGIKPGYGPPPPYEAVYAPMALDTPLVTTVTVKNIYAESHVVMPESNRDEPDFIGLELDFMRFLTEKEAQAWANDDQKEAMQATSKEREFLDEHILRWIPLYCDAMLEQARLDFYRGVARLTKGFVLGEAHRVVEPQGENCAA